MLRGEEQHLLLAAYLREVVIEVARLLQVVQDEHDGLLRLLQVGGEEKGCNGCVQPRQEDGLHVLVLELCRECLGVGVCGVDMLQFVDFHS